MKSALLICITFVLVSAGFSQTNKSYMTFPTESKTIFGICFSPKGNVLAVGDDTRIKFFSTATMKLLGTLNDGHDKMIMTIDISRDSSLLVSGGKDSLIMITELSSGRVKQYKTTV